MWEWPHKFVAAVSIRYAMILAWRHQGFLCLIETNEANVHIVHSNRNNVGAGAKRAV